MSPQPSIHRRYVCRRRIRERQMIISHRHKFIYLRTEKTGSSSVEFALSQFCGPEDIVTSGKGRWDSNLGIGRFVHIHGELRRHFPRFAGYYHHIGARQVSALVGPEIWNTYFKFTTERNPWDRQVSQYFYRQRKCERKVEFEEYISSPLYRMFHYVKLNNWKVYTIADRIAVDEVVRYENLQDQIVDLCRRLNIASDIQLPAKKTGIRPVRLHYREYYSPKTRDHVARWYAKEIDALGYRF